MERPAIDVRGLGKTYRVGAQNVHALTDASFTIRRGEYVAVMGPSGSGKSTCLHLLGCLQRPSAGQYLLEGQDVSDLSHEVLARTRNRKIGFLFQSANLLPRATAAKNVELPLIYRNMAPKQRRRRALEALEAVGLGDRVDHRPDQLSGGQMQRVSIARALVGNPSVILADEPTGALDSQTGAGIMELFDALNRDGATIVLVTHDAEIARRAARVLRFRDGRIVDDGVAA